MIIERALLRHQLEVAQGREALFRNNLGDHQALLNYCHQNMGRARHQVHQLAEQTFYVIKIIATGMIKKFKESMDHCSLFAEGVAEFV